MNKNYDKLIEYFKTNGALSKEEAIGIDQLQIDNVSGDDLRKMLNLMSTEFHQTNDGKFWYKKTPVFEKGLLTQIIIAFVLLTILVVILQLFVF